MAHDNKLYKAGDEFVVTDEMIENCGSMQAHRGIVTTLKITEVMSDTGYKYDFLDSRGVLLGRCTYCVGDEILPKSKTFSMNLKEKFALVFKGEPEKSFIKAGVMNSDESLTTDGKELFLSYLLKKNGDDFKATVVDPILAEKDE